jgi:antitoxin component of MazEF toxin-antitoxin module
MIKRLQQIGNSKGIILPNAVLRLFKWSDKTKLEMTVGEESITVKRAGK